MLLKTVAGMLMSLPRNAVFKMDSYGWTWGIVARKAVLGYLGAEKIH
jgi:hypothetical protein